MNIQLHKESGLSIRDAQTKEVLYQDNLENASTDAGIESLRWPNASILRIFSLADGRVAIVRETADGLRQEAASSSLESLLLNFTARANNIISAKAARASLDAEAVEDSGA